MENKMSCVYMYVCMCVCVYTSHILIKYFVKFYKVTFNKIKLYSIIFIYLRFMSNTEINGTYPCQSFVNIILAFRIFRIYIKI